MISVKNSNIGNNKNCYGSIKLISSSLNFFKKRESDVYNDGVDLINGIVRDLHSFVINKCNDFTTIEIAIIDKLNFFYELNAEISMGIEYHIKQINTKVKYILNQIEKHKNEEFVNNIRGLLTESVACSFIGDVNHQSESTLIWDCVFYKGNQLLKHIDSNGNQVKSVDIFCNSNDVSLYECKTRPYFKVSQFNFMNNLKSQFALEKRAANLFTFILQYEQHPSFQKEIRKIPSYFSILTIEDIKS